MPARHIRIRLAGRLDEHTVEILGGWTEEVADATAGDRVEIVVPLIDRAQLDGLLAQLGGLHIDYDRVVIEDATTGV